MFRTAALLVVCLLSFSASQVLASCVFTLQDPVWYLGGDFTSSVAAADFNEDGYDDVAVRLRDAIPQTIAVRLADGEGGLGAAIEYATSSDELVGDIGAGDINGDGHADIVVSGEVGDADAGRVHVLYGDGSGGFPSQSSYAFIRYSEIQNPFGVSVADFDHDGKDDIAVATISSLVIIEQGASALTKVFDIPLPGRPANHSALPLEITHGDFDDDGHLDVAVSELATMQIHAFFGKGDGTMTGGPSLAVDPEFWPDALTAADFDGDGDDDLAEAENGYADEGMRLNVYVSNGAARTFAARVEHALVGDSIDEARSTDLDGDGDFDIVLAGSVGVDVLLNDGSGNFPSKVSYEGYAYTLDIADVDGNGGPDVVTSAIDVYLNSCARAQLTLTSTANPSVVDSPVGFTATLHRPRSYLTPTGTLTLEHAGTTLATQQLWSGLVLWHATSDLPAGVNTLTARYSGDANFPASSVTLDQTVQLPPFGAPTRTKAAYASGHVTITWLGTEGVDHYEVWRKRGSDPWVLIAGPTAMTFADASVSPSAVYLYKVLGVTSSNERSPFGNVDLTHTFAFTDPVLTASTTLVRLSHLTELRVAINSARAAAGLGAASWAEPSPVVVKAGHWVEARTRLEEARSAIGMAAGTYASTAAGGAIIRAEHVLNLRKALE